MNKLVAIVGPTASGKTSLSLELAEYLGTEIVSGDSMQIYRGMDIGTAKPNSAEMRGIVHNMIDIADVSEKFTVYDFIKRAKDHISRIHAGGKIPVIAGGTGLYIDGLLTNTQFDEYESSSELRAELEDRADREGLEILYAQLAQSDAAYAQKISPNDRRRIIRALEVYALTGKPQSEHIAASRLMPSDYDVLIIGLAYSDREVLYSRINARVDEMMRQGLEGEVRACWEAGLEEAPTASQAIGYKEFYPYFRGEMSLEEAVDRIKISSRRYAKRQMTWFRRNPAINWIEIDREWGESGDDFGNIVQISKKLLTSRGFCDIIK